MIGLLIFPFENKRRGVDQLSEIIFFEGDHIEINSLDKSWGLTGFKIDRIHDFQHNRIEDIKTTPLKVLIYRLRNSIAHSRWEQVEHDKDISLFYDGTENKIKQGLGILYQTDENDPNKSKISALIFTDLNPITNEPRFKATIDMVSLEKFMEKFALKILDTSYSD